MAEILISRYEEFTANKYVTYITTNLFASEIEKQFGKRLLSPMRNMFTTSHLVQIVPIKC